MVSWNMIYINYQKFERRIKNFNFTIVIYIWLGWSNFKEKFRFIIIIIFKTLQIILIRRTIVEISSLNLRCIAVKPDEHTSRGVRGRVVRVFDLLRVTCPSPLWVRIPQGTLNSFMWGSFPASLRNVDCSIQVSARTGIWGLPPPEMLESRYITFTGLVRWKSQPKKIML